MTFKKIDKTNKTLVERLKKAKYLILTLVLILGISVFSAVITNPGADIVPVTGHVVKINAESFFNVVLGVVALFVLFVLFLARLQDVP